MKIRSITVFAPPTALSDRAQLVALGDFVQTARDAYDDAGFEVQTARLATNVFEGLDPSTSSVDMVDHVTEVEGISRDLGFEYVALGPATRRTQRWIPDLLAATESVFATAHIVSPQTGAVDGEAIRNAAYVIGQAADLEEGFGNLRFAALANVPEGTPFFPGAYWTQAQPAFGIATQSADLAVDACRDAGDAAEAHTLLVQAVEAHGRRIEATAQDLEAAHGLAFAGTDFSLAPFPGESCSIGGALERLSGKTLGSAGTLTAAAILADALQRATFRHTGFCGVMMPVLEDSVLAQRAAEGRLNTGELLQWSAVCGTGLDTVPLPGNATENALQRLLFDVAALSARLSKPLTARLMPLPGKSASDPVHFDFPYFADGGVLALDGEPGNSLLLETEWLPLHDRRSTPTTTDT
jgi:hypothetical protein